MHRRRRPSRARRFLGRAAGSADALELGVLLVRLVSWPLRLLLRLLE